MPSWIALLLAASAQAAPASPARAKIAVMDVRSIQGVSEGTATILTDIVVSDVARQGYDVVSKGDIAAMVGFEKQKQVLGCADETNCLAEIGGALGVDYMLTGQVGQIGSQYRISLLLVDTKKARVAARAAEFSEKNEDALVKAAQSTVRQLLATATSGSMVKPVPLPPPPVLAQSATAPRPAGPDRTKAWVAFGVSGAFLISGLAVGIVAKSKYNDLSSKVGQPGFAEAWYAQEQSIRTSALTADILYLGAAASAGLGAYFWVSADSRLSATPVPGGVAVAASGSF